MKVSCAEYIEYDKAEDLENLRIEDLPQPVKHIGSGSNLLFTGDFPGTVLHSAVKYIKYFDLGTDAVPVAVGAGVVFDDFVEKVCGDGLWGAENLSLIPGETGAAAVQNIGAYGVEAGDIISGVVCYDFRERKKVKFTADECGYAYRDSIFKHSDGRYAVLSVLFRLRRNYSPSLSYKGIRTALGIGENDAVPQDLSPMKVREAIIGIRRDKLPDPAETGSAGSFFKNPVVSADTYARIASSSQQPVPHYDLPDGTVKIPAAWMIEQCGFKGKRLGGAAVYEKQPLVLVNASGSASAADVLGLEDSIRKAVLARFGVSLECEVEHV